MTRPTTERTLAFERGHFRRLAFLFLGRLLRVIEGLLFTDVEEYRVLYAFLFCLGKNSKSPCVQNKLPCLLCDCRVYSVIVACHQCIHVHLVDRNLARRLSTTKRSKPTIFYSSREPIIYITTFRDAHWERKDSNLPTEWG